MKYFNPIKRLFCILGIVVLSVTTVSTNLSCDTDPCDAIALADLTIPVIADLFDQFGNPIIDQNTGQIIQGLNELYYNRRTQELFNNQFPPSQGVLVGDVIDMATSIYNVFSPTNCELGNTAGPSTTAPRLTINGPLFSGEQPLQGMFTPQVPSNGKVFTATAFEILTPGFYTVDFNANAPRNVPEHNFDNNFYFGDNGTYNSSNRITKNCSFYVENTPNRIANKNPSLYAHKDLAPKNLEEMKNLEIYKIINSDRLENWYREKYNLKQQ
ncbi:hypothetical protein [Psychroserpens luteolus]|uniref:hypothetical protein n=1 Tax=Psychroserpens luteolus TaxID=2855840 RepID=UPI001E64D144|nr:hypothetical protein [Psychroserpens luteolus]MCD2260427.1 hypothetical protein [Psychroserpens luteolus]